MRKHWIALLSTLGLAGAAVSAPGQVLKGRESEVAPAAKNQAVTKSKTSQSNATKLSLKQQKLRQQNQTGNTGTQGALTKAKDDAALTKAGTQNQLTKAGANANNQLTKAGTGANNQLTKAKSNAALTKANANTQLTKAKNNTALTKAKSGAPQ